jgi:hypothetical protein
MLGNFLFRVLNSAGNLLGNNARAYIMNTFDVELSVRFTKLMFISNPKITLEMLIVLYFISPKN